MKKLNIYFTAGAPELNSVSKIMAIIQDAGADMMEIGIPYSDPIADGPVIQEAHALALNNGMTVDVLLTQLVACKEQIKIPVLLMSYFNPILQYGFEDFCEKCQKIGITGLIIPDLSSYELEHHYLEILKKYQLQFSCLVTPETSDKRIHYLDSLSSGFLYAVSSSSTTGAKKTPLDTNYLNRLKQINTKNPFMLGFGIGSAEDFHSVCNYVSGGIIGTAFVKILLENPQDWEQKTKDFIETIKNKK